MIKEEIEKVLREVADVDKADAAAMARIVAESVSSVLEGEIVIFDATDPLVDVGGEKGKELAEKVAEVLKDAGVPAEAKGEVVVVKVVPAEVNAEVEGEEVIRRLDEII